MKKMLSLSPGKLLLLVLLLLAATILFGCGKKTWPEPKAVEERFSWESVDGRIENDCLVLRAEMGGNWGNLASVALEVVETDIQSECLGCPFQPSSQIELVPGSMEFPRVQQVLILRYCPDSPLPPESRYRWRLVGKNSNQGLSDTVSPIGLTGR